MVGSIYKILSEIEACKLVNTPSPERDSPLREFYGARSFIFSGNSHIDECNALGERVMPELKT